MAPLRQDILLQQTHRRRDCALPEASYPVSLDNASDDSRGGSVGVLLGLEPSLDEIYGV